MSNTTIQRNATLAAKRHDTAKGVAAARLASGKQINRASEGAAELAAAAKLSSATKSVAAATSNARRAVSFGQIADGAMGQIQDEVVRMKELAVSASSDTFDDVDRAKANAEVTKRLDTISKIVSTTRFGDAVLLDGTGGDSGMFKFQVAEKAGDEVTLDLSAKFDIATLTLGDINVNTYADAQIAIGNCDEAIGLLNDGRAAVGAFMAGMESTITVNEVKGENLQGALDVLMSADIAKEATNQAIADIRSQLAQTVISKENRSAASVLVLLQ